jgi:hypothetical protein
MKGELLTMITKIISAHPNMNKGYADNITQFEKASTDSKGTCDSLSLGSLARLSKL